MELGMKCFECKFILDYGDKKVADSRYVFSKYENTIERYLRSRLCIDESMNIYDLKIQEIYIMEGVVLK